MDSPLISYDTYRLILYAWIGLAIIIFFVLLKITAPYGRHTTSGWGPSISNRLGWTIMEAPVLLVLGFFVLSSVDHQTMATWIMTGLFAFHYINRTFIFPFRLNTKGKKMPLLIVGSAVFFNLMNGFSLGYYFKHFADYPTYWILDIRFILGLLLFITGLVINWKADNDLIRLRKPGETHYVIPRSGMFRYISCPNLFGELIEWLGFAILCWNLPAATFFIWTAANLIPRALSHHRWYKEKFTEYPADRKAIIPFLW
jgi:3-oxo-5-alpha-steroid 4-dehydrogenase 1